MYNALVVYIVYNWDVYTCEWITVRMKASSATQTKVVTKAQGVCCESTWRQYFIITRKKQSRTWKHSQCNRIVETLKGEGALCYLGHWTKQKWLRFVLLRFFFLSLSVSIFRIRKEEIWWKNGMGGCCAFDFFFIFFTCFSNVRWKMPTRRTGAGLEHPFPWFWQLLAFVSAMEIIPNVC